MWHYYFKLAWTRLRRTPWFTSLMIISLAVGLAASMTTITLRYVLGRDPIPNKSARLFNLQARTTSTPMGNMFSYQDARALTRLDTKHANAVLSGEGVTTSLSVAGQHQTIRQGIGIRYTTPDFFRMFNVPIKRGRIWTPAEESSAAPVTVLDAETAQDLFHGGNPIGKQLRVGNTQYTVIGVTGYWNPQPRYYDLNGDAGAFGSSDALYLPLTTMQYAPTNLMVSRACPGPRALTDPPNLLSSTCRWLSIWYLARDERDIPALKQTLAQRLRAVLPASRARELQLLNVRKILIKADVVPAPVRLYALLGTAFLVLCVINASGMQLSRVLRASTHIGIRRALGARRMEIIKQFLCDALLVSGIGGSLGVALTFAGLYVVRHLPGMYYGRLAHMDGAMLVLMVVLILVCSILIGVMPAWLASRTDPALLIKAPQ